MPRSSIRPTGSDRGGLSQASPRPRGIPTRLGPSRRDGLGDSRANLPFFTKNIIVGVFLRHDFANHERQEAVVKQDLAEVDHRPPSQLKDGPRTGVYRHGFSSTERGIQGRISRADVADFMLKQLTDPLRRGECRHENAMLVDFCRKQRELCPWCAAERG